jgi:hypothetical protein
MDLEWTSRCSMCPFNFIARGTIRPGGDCSTKSSIGTIVKDVQSWQWHLIVVMQRTARGGASAHYSSIPVLYLPVLHVPVLSWFSMSQVKSQYPSSPSSPIANLSAFFLTQLAVVLVQAAARDGRSPMRLCAADGTAASARAGQSPAGCRLQPCKICRRSCSASWMSGREHRWGQGTWKPPAVGRACADPHPNCGTSVWNLY